MQDAFFACSLTVYHGDIVRWACCYLGSDADRVPALTEGSQAKRTVREALCRALRGPVPCPARHVGDSSTSPERPLLNTL